MFGGVLRMHTTINLSVNTIKNNETHCYNLLFHRPPISYLLNKLECHKNWHRYSRFVYSVIKLFGTHVYLVWKGLGASGCLTSELSYLPADVYFCFFNASRKILCILFTGLRRIIRILRLRFMTFVKLVNKKDIILFV